MSSIDDCYDDPGGERFLAALECELLEHRPMKVPEDARRAALEYIEDWYNPPRRHAGIDFRAPTHHEGKRETAATARTTASPELVLSASTPRRISLDGNSVSPWKLAARALPHG